MTIYKPKNASSKSDKKVLLSVVEIHDEEAFGGKKKVVAAPAVIVLQLQNRRRVRLLLFLLLIIIFASLCAAGAYFIYRTKFAKKPYMWNCIVPYYEESDMIVPERHIGEFTEQVEIDQDEGLYEKLDVPPILESMRSTVVHDFERNLTAIVDRDNARCFVLPLNRTAVKPPKSFLDLLIKFKAGYYLPDAKIVRENYRVQFPAIENLDEFGYFIRSDCQNYATYLLVHEDQPYAMVKRSACDLSDMTFSLGDTGGDMLLITLQCM